MGTSQIIVIFVTNQPVMEMLLNKTKLHHSKHFWKTHEVPGILKPQSYNPMCPLTFFLLFVRFVCQMAHNASLTEMWVRFYC